MKVLIGPLNIASQPYYLAQGLRKHGVDATSISYVRDADNVFKYKQDWAINIADTSKSMSQIYSDAIKESLDKGFDIYHFFQRSFLVSSGKQDLLTGMDIPLLKARGKRIAYRFTGWEVIDHDIEKAQNPYSALHEDWECIFDQTYKKEFIQFLKGYVDEFMVVDPMMQESIPEAKIVPRLVDMSNLEHIGIEKKKKPLVLHAPTNPEYKGTKYILKAFDQLKSEGLDFDVKMLNMVPFEEALEWYKKADIIVDQIHVGWYGVLAVECMAMGKPVAVYMREDLAPKNVPICNINKDNIVEKLRTLITDHDARENLAQRARPYALEHHDEDVIIPQLIDVYKGIMEKEPVFPQPGDYSDVEFLKLQREHIEKRLNSRSMRDILRSGLRYLPEPAVHRLRQYRNRLKMMECALRSKINSN